MSTTVQINVRMDQSLRDAGNAALGGKGLSPSLFVRAVWEKLAQRGEALEILLDAVFDKTEPHGDQSPVECGQALYATFLHDACLEGRTRNDAVEERAFDEMVEDAVVERWNDRSLGNG
jgi:hypothetical protein